MWGGRSSYGGNRFRQELDKDLAALRSLCLRVAVCVSVWTATDIDYLLKVPLGAFLQTFVCFAIAALKTVLLCPHTLEEKTRRILTHTAHLCLMVKLSLSLDVSYLVDPASSHMLVSKIKPCTFKYKP